MGTRAVCYGLFKGSTKGGEGVKVGREEKRWERGRRSRVKKVVVCERVADW